MDRITTLPVLTIAGNIASLLLYASPLVTIIDIYQNGSIGNHSVAPNVTTLFECALSIWYDQPSVSPTPPAKVLIVSEVGLILQIICIAFFLFFATAEERKEIWSLLIQTAACFLIVGFISVYAIDRDKKRMFVCGVAATISTIISYGSPFSVMMRAMETKSIKYMPLPFSACVFFSSAIWFSHGAFFKRDQFMCIANAFGLVLGSGELILIAIHKYNEWKNKTADGSQENKNDECQSQQEKPSRYVHNSQDQNRLSKKIEEMLKRKEDFLFPETTKASSQAVESQV